MKLKLYALAAVPLALGAALAWSDTSDYRAALVSLDEITSISAIEVQAKALDRDMARASNCQATETNEGLVKNTPEGRECMIEAMTQVETPEGALIVATSAVSWLLRHPADEDFRTAAVEAIDKGRSKLVANMPTLNRMAMVSEAHDRSMVLRLRDGYRSLPNQFGYLANSLDNIEFKVMLPTVVAKQSQWRMKAVSDDRNPEYARRN